MPTFPPFWLIPILPFAGALLLGLTNRRMPRTAVGLVACGSVLASFGIAVASFAALLRLAPDARGVEHVLFPWITSGDFHAPFAFRFDPLSAVMTLVVTGVGFLIHVYSIGYMSHDRGVQRYFTYLNLFTGSMLLLVLANNYALMFVGWEAVGLCSYLLIGFWFEKKSAADAGKKAFIVNRVGDFGFLLGVMLLFLTFGSVTYTDVLPHAHDASTAVLTAITLLLFVGATGKSAQIPLYVWLPDAMEGPTPVSALIHAATMVTAGVYMVARSSALYVLAPTTMAVVAGIGIATALFAATIAIAQNDIKRVLAYSTVSQLGYMFAACGVGAFGIGIFHVMTHAFFKALLFLGSGSVIHALSGEQDMRRMGGLKARLPWTYRTMLIGTLAIAGIPPLAGFVSKDAILTEAFVSGHALVYAIGLLVAGLTAFYMFRLVILTFFGASRVEAHAAEHCHESPPTMLVPLFVLAVLSVVGGWIGLPAMFGLDRIQRFLAPALASEHGAHAAASTEYVLMTVSVAIAVLGIFTAVAVFRAYRVSAEAPRGLQKILVHKWYVDEIYDAILVRPLIALSAFFAWVFDVWIVDGAVNGIAALVQEWGQGLRRVQTGQVALYAGVFLVGVVWLVSYVVTAVAR